MNLPDDLLDSTWYWMAWAVWCLVLFLCLRRAPWQRFRESDHFNLWLGMVVLLVVVWSLKAGVLPGLNLHLLGVMLFTLTFGPALAFIGLNLVLVGLALNGSQDWFSLALNGLIMAGVGITISHTIFRWVDRYLPNQPFVYIFVNGFFGSALTVMGVGLSASVVLALGGAYDWPFLVENYLMYFLLLGFSEAWLSGMMVTLFLVYRPGWLGTFDDRRYLKREG